MNKYYAIYGYDYENEMPERILQPVEVDQYNISPWDIEPNHEPFFNKRGDKS